MAGTERVVYIPDVHCGDHDARAVALAVRIIRYLKPHRVIQLGDFVDFNGLSSFEQGSSTPYLQIQAELNVGHEILADIKAAAPKARRQMIEGNHEERLAKWLKRNPAFQGLKALDLPSLLGLERHGWEPALHKTLSLSNGTFLVKHGSRISGDAGQSAKKELMASMSSGISGHTHRMATFTYRAHGGLFQWTEAGCLQNNPPRWKEEVQNWQHGLVVGEHETAGNAFSIITIPFRESYRANVMGREIHG